MSTAKITIGPKSLLYKATSIAIFHNYGIISETV